MVTLTLGATASPTTVHASVRNGTARSTGVAFTATAKAGTPTTLWLWGYYQLGIADSTLEYAAHARDGHGSCPECGNLVVGVPIAWAVTAGGGTITPAQDTTAIIPGVNATYPLSRAVHRLGPQEGATTVTATGPTITGAPSVAVTTTVVTKAVVVQWGGFLPDTVEVPSGRSVGWRWSWSGDSDDDHNVTFEDVPTQPTSSPTQRDGQLVRTFTGASRTIRYRCTLHSTSFAEGEVGVVIVR